MTYLQAIAVSPFSWPGRDNDELKRLDDRALDLGVIVSTERCYGRYPGWKVRVRSKEQPERVVGLRSSGEGPLEPVLAGALDDFESAYSGEAWTAAELVQVAIQSGIPVERG